MARLEELGKYQLIKRIAVGGMSEIYLASQGGLEGFERAVIVKCIRDDLMDEREADAPALHVLFPRQNNPGPPVAKMAKGYVVQPPVVPRGLAFLRNQCHSG